MHIEFDPAKNERNILERGLSFERVSDFDFDTASIWQDTRKPYPEARYVALGLLDSRLHVLCFTPAAGGIRVISIAHRGRHLHMGARKQRIKGSGRCTAQAGASSCNCGTWDASRTRCT